MTRQVPICHGRSSESLESAAQKLIGKRFGKLIIINFSHVETNLKGKNKVILEVQCDCGSRKLKVYRDIIRKRCVEPSCGCVKKKTEYPRNRKSPESRNMPQDTSSYNKDKNIGKRFGKLVIIDFSHVERSEQGRSRAIYDVKCDCGTKKKVSYNTLRDGNSISCGCIKIQQTKKMHAKTRTRETYMKNLWHHMKQNRTERFKGKNFGIDLENFSKIVIQNCTYCGIEPLHKYRKNELHDYIYFNGLDRIDNSRGYEIGNIVPCCGSCNQAKNTLTKYEFINHIEKIYNFMMREARVE